MPGLTPTRVRLTLSQKVKIIEESKKSDFSRKKICEEYSISKATISSILKDQKTHLENYDSGIPGKHKTMRKPDFPGIECTLYEWFKKTIEESQSKQTNITKFFPVNQLTLKYLISLYR